MTFPTTFDTPNSVLAALTTLFAAPPSCATPTYYGVAFKAGDPPIINTDFSGVCNPSSFLHVYGTYSPGMCPSGYTTLFSVTITGTTSALCCPDDGGNWNLEFGWCASIITTSVFVQSWFTGKGDQAFTATILPSALLGVTGVHVLYEEKDLSQFPAGYTPGQISAPSTTTQSIGSLVTTSSQQATGIPTPASTGSPSRTGSSSGLSIGAKVGIGIGLGISIVILTLGILFVIWKRKKLHIKAISYPSGPELHDEDIKEICGRGIEQRDPILGELGVPENHRFVPQDSNTRENAGTEMGQEHKNSAVVDHTQFSISQETSRPAQEPVELGTTDIHDRFGELESHLAHTHKPSPPNLGFGLEQAPKHNPQDSRSGPVQEYLDKPVQGPTGVAPEVEEERDMAVTVASPLSEQELEIQWLAREEARIRERKEWLERELKR